MYYLDLFAGAGGLSEGFIRADFTPLAHIESNKYACMTLETRSAYYYLKANNMLNYYKKYQMSYHETASIKQKKRYELLELIPDDIIEPIINEEISTKTLPKIFEIIDHRMKTLGIEELDLVIGGPPCQAYSLVGRARDKNNMENDPRNYLYKLYVRFLNKYHPKAFVFENVPGILTAMNGALFKNIQSYMKRVGYNIEARKIDARNCGVLQSRVRVIIVGWRKDFKFTYPEFEDTISTYTVNDILYDLPKLNAGQELSDFHYTTNAQINNYLKSTNIRTDDDILTHHNARPHNKRDLTIYLLAVKKWNKDQCRLKYTDIPESLRTHKNLTSFLDRFKVVAGNKHYSHTIVSHISKDGHHYIHPDIEQNRSLTVRESARIQSFPDNYYFEGPRTANYTQIGNAVPPLMSEKLALWFKNHLNQ